ncbi:MAG: response regulator [Candidatus Omnitrophota bacterium]
MDAKKKILVVDDEKDLCTLMKGILENSGQYEVFVTYDGLEAKKLCQKEKPDLIFLDFIMPKIRGDDVIKLLKKNPETKDIPIIIISGFGELTCLREEEQWRAFVNMDSVRQEGKVPGKLKLPKLVPSFLRELGAESFLPKPFSKEKLLDTAKSVLKKTSQTKG